MALNGDRLAVWRKEKDLSQHEVAAKIGITQVYYSQLENGKKNPSICVLEKITEVTGLSLETLLNSANPPLPPRRKRKETLGAKTETVL